MALVPEPARDGRYPARDGNLVRPWIDGVPFYERLAEALRNARSSVWAIVSFVQPAFVLPDGTHWWKALRDCRDRGVDVRVLFWRNPEFFSTKHVFLGAPDDRAALAAARITWAARWDQSPDEAHCHHQKAFVVDANEDSAIAFVGGMVLSASTLARPGHHHGLQKHDAFVELQGPVVVDAAHNFIQRWNFARPHPDAPPWPDAEHADDLPWPSRVPPPAGTTVVQLARTARPTLYPEGPTHAGVHGESAFDSQSGESAIREQYLSAINAAKKTIYLENQHPGEASVLEALDAALERGVRVVLVVPGDPMGAIYQTRAEVASLEREGRAHEHRYGPTFVRFASLARHPGFTLAALARSDRRDGVWVHREIYTHAKLCVVDASWATIGSANLVDLSLCCDHTELNAAFWSEAVAGSLLRQLIREHTDEDAPTDDIMALEHFATRSRASRASLDAGGPVLGGCYAIDPTRYALDRPPTEVRG